MDVYHLFWSGLKILSSLVSSSTGGASFEIDGSHTHDALRSSAHPIGYIFNNSLQTAH